MTKISAKKQYDTQMRITVYFGYALFFIVVVGLLIPMLPWAQQWANPLMRHWSVITMMIAFIVAAVLPPLVGYIAGDKATRNKSELIHHYNGVLFGVLGMWLSLTLYTLIASIEFFAQQQSALASFILSYGATILAIISVVVLAIFYARHTNHQHSLLNYKPFQALFILSIIVQFGAAGVSMATGSWYGADPLGSVAVLLLPAVMIVVLIIFGAWIVGKRNGSKTQRLMKSLIALSFGLLSINAITNFSFGIFNSSMASVAMFVAIAVWVAWMVLFRRFPSIEK